MIRIFIDSVIILDLLLKRDDYSYSAELMTKILNKEYSGFTTPIAIANIYYIMAKYAGKNKAIQNIQKLRKIVSILAVTEEIIDSALTSGARDFWRCYSIYHSRKQWNWFHNKQK